MLKKLFTNAYQVFENNQNTDLQITEIEKKIGYKFKNKNILIKAFKHRSYLSISNEPGWESNERLEFLGDAVLELVVTEMLYGQMPEKLEGDLSKFKSILVSRKVLAEIVSEMGLGKYLLLNRGEEKAGGRERSSNLSNLYESIIGAIYIDAGYNPSRKFINKTLLKKYDNVLVHEKYTNFKSILLEYSQSKGLGNPNYKLLKESGPDHNKKFKITVSIDNRHSAGGMGASKKKAEQIAAQNLLKIIAPHLINNDNESLV